MGKFAKQSKIGTPLFDGRNYAFWSIMMRDFIESQGIEIWQIIENGYKVPKTVPTDAAELIQSNNNSKSKPHIKEIENSRKQNFKYIEDNSNN